MSPEASSETPAIDPAALPEPDRWIGRAYGRAGEALAPAWDNDVQNVIAWPDGVEAIPGGFAAHLDDLERYALAIIAAVRYARRSVAVSADTEDEPPTCPLLGGARADAIDRVRRFVGAYDAAKEGLDAERVATFDDHRLLLSDLRVLIGGAE